MFIYNCSLFFFFWTLMQFFSFNVNTLNSLIAIKNNSLYLITLTFIFFSIAGIPPFIGFFSKILILVSLLNSNFFFLYFFFFILLFFALYFYLQNLRFLYSTNRSKINYFFFNYIFSSHIFVFFTLLGLIFISLGFLFFDDLMVFFFWLLS